MSAPTNDALTRAMAEALGWEVRHDLAYDDKGLRAWVCSKNGKDLWACVREDEAWRSFSNIPPYATSADAMREAEAALGVRCDVEWDVGFEWCTVGVYEQDNAFRIKVLREPAGPDCEPRARCRACLAVVEARKQQKGGE